MSGSAGGNDLLSVSSAPHILVPGSAGSNELLTVSSSPHICKCNEEQGGDKDDGEEGIRKDEHRWCIGDV